MLFNASTPDLAVVAVVPMMVRNLILSDIVGITFHVGWEAVDNDVSGE